MLLWLPKSYAAPKSNLTRLTAVSMDLQVRHKVQRSRTAPVPVRGKDRANLVGSRSAVPMAFYQSST